MVDQNAYVEKILRHYQENDIQQGDPNEGVWHEAHFPLPKHLGNRTVLLLREHHAVQGVLQSEELQRCCVWGWEKDYLTGDLLEKFHYWKRQGCLYARKISGGSSARVQIERQSGIFDPNNEKVRKGRLKGLEKARTAENQSKRGHIGGSKTKERGHLAARWVSLIDPTLISNAPGVSRLHKKRGWDINAKIRVDTIEAPIHTYGPNI